MTPVRHITAYFVLPVFALIGSAGTVCADSIEDLCKEMNTANCLNSNYNARHYGPCGALFARLKTLGKAESDCKPSTQNPSRPSEGVDTKSETPAQIIKQPVIKALDNTAAKGRSKPLRLPPSPPPERPLVEQPVVPGPVEPPESLAQGPVPAVPTAVAATAEGETPKPANPPAPQAAAAPPPPPPAAGDKHACHTYHSATSPEQLRTPLVAEAEKPEAPSLAKYFPGLQPEYDCAGAKPTDPKGFEEWTANCRVPRLQQGMEGYCSERRLRRTGCATDGRGCCTQPVKAIKPGTAAALQQDLKTAISFIIDKQLAPEPGVVNEEFAYLEQTILDGFNRFKTRYADEIKGLDRPKQCNDILALARAIDSQLDSYIIAWAWKGPYLGAVTRRCAHWEPTDKSQQACMDRLLKGTRETLARHKADGIQADSIDDLPKRRSGGRDAAFLLGGVAIGAGGMAAIKRNKCPDDHDNVIDYRSCMDDKRLRDTGEDCCARVTKPACREKLRCKKANGKDEQ